MTLDAVDVHVHVRTGDRAKSDHRSWKDAQKLFGGGDHDGDIVEHYRTRNMMAVVFDVDSGSSTGERADNDEIAELVQRSDGTFLGLCAVDPMTGKRALMEAERCHALGFRGMKVQPVSQGFHVDDRAYYPLWDFAQQVGWPLMVHTGTTGIGAGSPGGAGLKLRYGRPVPHLDDVAADFPNLQIIAAHFAWPWHLELMAVARQKGNVWVDLSGWSPKYFPEEVVRYCNSVIPEKFLFGSDFPLLAPDRWMADFDKLGMKDEVRHMVLVENACRLFGIEA